MLKFIVTINLPNVVEYPRLLWYKGTLHGKKQARPNKSVQIWLYRCCVLASPWFFLHVLQSLSLSCWWWITGTSSWWVASSRFCAIQSSQLTPSPLSLFPSSLVPLILHLLFLPPSLPPSLFLQEGFASEVSPHWTARIYFFSFYIVTLVSHQEHKGAPASVFYWSAFTYCNSMHNLTIS